MTPPHTNDIEADLNTRLSRMEGKMDDILKTIPDHESRLRKIERTLNWYGGGLAFLVALITWALTYFKFKDH